MSRRGSIALVALSLAVAGTWFVLERPPAEPSPPAGLEREEAGAEAAHEPGERAAGTSPAPGIPADSDPTRVDAGGPRPDASAPVRTTWGRPVLVRVRGRDGALVRAISHDVALTYTGLMGVDQVSREASTEGGVARFDGVPHGTLVEARLDAHAVRWKEAEARGVVPEDPDAPLVLDLHTAWTAVVLRGRLVDDGGAALARTPAQSRLRRTFTDSTEQVVAQRQLVSEDDGEFRVYLERWELAFYARDEGSRTSLLVYVTTPEGEILLGESEAISEQGLERTLNLGDVVLRPAPIVAEGVVVDEAGGALLGAAITVEVVMPADRRQELRSSFLSSRLESALPSVTDIAGTFTVFGPHPDQDVSVLVELQGYHADKTAPQAPGARPLRIVMRPTGELEGSVRLPEGVRSSPWVATLSKAGELDRWERTLDHSAGLRWDAGGDVAHVADLDGAFAWRNLPAGLYAVALRHGAFEEATLVVNDVLVVAGETRRPDKLQDLDPAALEHAVTLTVVGAEGAPLRIAHVWSDEVRALRSPRSFSTGRTTIHVTRLPFSLGVGAPGHRNQRLEGVDGDRRVVLEPGIPVRLELPPTVTAAERERLKVGIGSTEASGVGVFVPGAPLLFGRDGAAETRLSSSGRWSVRLAMSMPSARPSGGDVGTHIEGGSIDIDVADREELQTYQLRVTREALDAATTRLAALAQDG